MSGCPSGAGKEGGWESGSEGEAECDPCTRGGCRDWQRTPDFTRSLPAPYLDASTREMMWRVRTVIGSTLGSLFVGGWIYHKYLHYLNEKEAAKEAARAKRKARAKVKKVKFERTEITGTSSAEVPKTKLESAVVDAVVASEVRGLEKVDRLAMGEEGSNKIVSSGIKKELVNVEAKKKVESGGKNVEVGLEHSDIVVPGAVSKPDVKTDFASSTEPQKEKKVFVSNTDSKTEAKRGFVFKSARKPEAKKELDSSMGPKTGAKKTIVSITPTIPEVRKDYPYSTGVKKELVSDATSKPEVKKDFVPSKTPKPEVKNWVVFGTTSKQEPGKDSISSRATKPEEFLPSEALKPEVKKEFISTTTAKSEVKKGLVSSTASKPEARKEFIASTSPKLDDKILLLPRPDLKSEVKNNSTKYSTEIKIQRGGIAQDEEKTKTREKPVLTVLTQGKDGKEVKRRGWK